MLDKCAPNSVNSLIADLNRTVLNNDHLTNDMQMKTAFEVSNTFFLQNPQLKDECYPNQFESGLTLEEFMEIGQLASSGVSVFTFSFSSNDVPNCQDCLRQGSLLLSAI